MSCAPLPRCPPMSASNRHRNRHQSGTSCSQSRATQPIRTICRTSWRNRASVPIRSDINVGVGREKLTPKLTPAMRSLGPSLGLLTARPKPSRAETPSSPGNTGLIVLAAEDLVRCHRLPSLPSPLCVDFFSLMVCSAVVCARLQPAAPEAVS